MHRDLESYDQHRKKNPQGFRILLLNPEKVTPIRDKLRRRKWDRFIWDEAQRLKNRSSQSSRDAALIAKSSRKRLALTGTPMDLDPKDLWAIMRFVAPDVLGDVWKDFENEYLEKPAIDPKKIAKIRGVIRRQKMLLAYQIAKRKAPVRKDKLDELAELIRPHAMRISKEDAGIDVAKVKVIKFNLDERHEELYRKLEKTMMLKHKGKVIKAPLKIVQIGKLQQITGGYIKDEDGEIHEVGTSKRRLLRKQILKRVKPGEPFVVFCKYVHEVHMVARMIERLNCGKGAKLWGKVKDGKLDKKRTNIILDFQSGKLDWVVCQQRTGGVGVDLYRGRKFFVYSMGHSFIDYDQMLSRGDFMFSDEPAEFIILAVEFSIDTDVVVSVERKQSITELFYDRLQRQA